MLSNEKFREINSLLSCENVDFTELWQENKGDSNIMSFTHCVDVIPVLGFFHNFDGQ